jgi:hypothetical protein
VFDSLTGYCLILIARASNSKMEGFEPSHERANRSLATFYDSNHFLNGTLLYKVP